MIRDVWDDLRLGFRQLLRRPGFALAAIASLALGIGANTVLFGVLNRVMFRDLPGISEPERVLELGRGSEGSGFDTFAAPDIDDVRASVPALDRVYGFRLAPLNVRTGTSAERAVGYEVSEDYFEALGARMALGRAFTATDRATLAAEPAVVLSDAAWRHFFAAAPDVVGRAITVNGASFRVLGVTAPEFRGHIVAFGPDVFVPLSLSPLINSNAQNLLTSRQSRWLLAGARLAPGATIDDARTQLDVLAKRLAASYPDSHEGLRLNATPLSPLPAEAHQAVALFSGVMFALVGLILVMACVNVAGMLLARGESRRGELALRIALGAARGRIVRQLFAEGLALALAAGVAGLVLAAWLRGLLAVIPLPAPIPLDLTVPLDGNVFAFAALVSVATALLAALWPALRISQRDPRSALGAAGAGVSPTRTRARNTLVVAQLAVSLVLLVSAALFLRSLGRAADVDPGFRADGVSYAEFDLQPAGYDDKRALGVADALLERVRRMPGVESAATVAMLPLSLSRMGFGAARAAPDAAQLDPNVNTLSPGYFGTLDIALQQGRDFTDQDLEGAESVAVINRTFARQLFGEADALGKTFQLGGRDSWRTLRVVGLTGDGKYASLDETGTPFCYLPVKQWPRQSQHLVIRSRDGAATLEKALRGELAAVDPNLPPLNVHPLTDVTAISVLPQRIAGYVATVLGLLGLLLAGTGLYGVLALHVAERRREIGVRLALGATPAGVVRNVARRAARLVALGMAIGAVLAAGMAQALSSLLFGIAPSDALAVLGAIAVLALGAGLAIVAPAWRASRIDPMAALRYE